MAVGARQLLAGSAAVTVAAAATMALAGVRHAYAERALLTSAPTRQIIVADARSPADLHRYAAAITDAPVDPALLNRWIAASPSDIDRAAGFTLLQRMGFRDTGAQLDIMADALSRGDAATFAARIDALFAQQVGTAAIAGVLSVMERDPRLQPFVVDRLSTRPVWRARYLFDPVALIEPAGRQARLATLRALGAGDDLRAAFAFASRESWKHRDVAAAEAFWRAGSAGAAASSDAHFPFEWQLGSTADFEGSLIRRGDLLSVRVDWNGHGTAPFVARRIAGPIEKNAALAEITAARGDLSRIDVVYRCQGSGWRIASPVATRDGAAFRAGEALDCPAGEIGIVPADEPGRETTLRFRLPVARPNENVAR